MAKIRSTAAQSLLEDIASSGAAAGNTHGLHTPASPALDELLERGYVCPMELLNRTDHGYYTLTALGRSFIKPAVELCKPVPLLKWKRLSVGTDLSQYTLAELIFHLGNQGWQDQEHAKSKKTVPFKSQGMKVWYRSPMFKISKLYLHALAVAEERFQAGLIDQVCHFQPQAYYRCIIEACSNVLPDQPLAYYKLLMGQEESGKRQPNQTRLETETKLHGQSTTKDDLCNQAWIVMLVGWSAQKQTSMSTRS